MSLLTKWDTLLVILNFCEMTNLANNTKVDSKKSFYTCLVIHLVWGNDLPLWTNLMSACDERSNNEERNLFSIQQSPASCRETHSMYPIQIPFYDKSLVFCRNWKNLTLVVKPLILMIISIDNHYLQYHFPLHSQPVTACIQDQLDFLEGVRNSVIMSPKNVRDTWVPECTAMKSELLLGKSATKQKRQLNICNNWNIKSDILS